MIKSSKRFTYREAKAVLDGLQKSQTCADSQAMVKVPASQTQAAQARKHRKFSLTEQVVMVDERGSPRDLIRSSGISHRMVEEFMLKANEIVATHLSSLGKDMTYRIHDKPCEEELKRISMCQGLWVLIFQKSRRRKRCRSSLMRQCTSAYGRYLASNFIRRMRLAIYSPENIGHYGLGLTHYCHFTSPIRRYVDLVIHRILFGESDDLESLEIIAADCSEQERISAKAETSVVLLKKLRLVKAMQEKEPQRQYEAVITRVKNFGFFFEVIDFMLESFLHVSEIGNDFYIFEEAQMRLKGRWEGQALRGG